MIEDALERSALHEGKRIQVQVHDGAVTLTGRVRSYAEKRAVMGAVGHAPGVHTVNDHLHVDPYA
jgi:osmotically-inducible protein OsmY